MALTFPHDYNSPLSKSVIRVDDKWYDCTAWRHSHPGGAQIIDQFHEKDATDAFYAFHSEEAIRKLHAMKGKPVAEKDLSRGDISEDFEAWRQELKRDGWFTRNWVIDIFCNIVPVMACLIIGTMISYSHPLLATLLIGFGMQQCGWLGHDYVHGRGKASLVLGIAFGALVNGFSSRWWSQKHNVHHTFPNRKEFDADIHNEPILHLWFPEEKDDKWYRKYQHLYYPIAYSFLYASWRLQSIQFVLGSKDWLERGLISLGYIWLACLPFSVALGSILIGGFCVAVVVTANHQTEDVIASDAPYNFIADQYNSTRGVICSDIFFEYFFGGLQYQLEHHLFPTMPRYYYPLLRPLVKKFAKEHGLQCNANPVMEIMKLNYDVMKKYAGSGKKLD